MGGLGGMMGNILNRGTSSSTTFSPARSSSSSSSSSATGSRQQQQQHVQGQAPMSQQQLTAESVAALPPPGQSGPSSFSFSPKSGRYLSFLSPASPPVTSERRLSYIDMNAGNGYKSQPLITSHLLSPGFDPSNGSSPQSPLSLEERLRRERQRVHSSGVTSFSWNASLQIVIPFRGNVYIQNGIGGTLNVVYDKAVHGEGVVAIDPQLSPDGRWVAFVLGCDIYVASVDTKAAARTNLKRVTYGGGDGVTHGLADFIAQEEMERHRGFWWHPSSEGILFARVDERDIPVYRISYHGEGYEDHRYPFSGGDNPKVTLGYVTLPSADTAPGYQNNKNNSNNNKIKHMNVRWFRGPEGCEEYLARVCWLPDGSAAVQWQNRAQTLLSLVKLDVHNGGSVILLEERSDVWINLHHMMRPLPVIFPPNGENESMPQGSFSFLFASERTGYCHLYLYTYKAGSSRAMLIRAVSQGEWLVETIVGVDVDGDIVYVTGTYDSPLERHLYALPLLHRYSNETPSNPIRLTTEAGMHNIVMDHQCRYVVDSSSDLARPTSIKIYTLTDKDKPHMTLRHLTTLHDSKISDERQSPLHPTFAPPELLSFPSADNTTELHAALYRPDPKTHGPGPYPLITSVYGGPHVQRVNRSHSQTTDMRAQRLRSLGFAVLKCDNRGSARRGLRFEACLKGRMGRLEVLDQVAAVRQLTMRGIADPHRVGIYGWSYGGYLAAMCLCRAPEVFRVAVAGAPVTSWDGYDTHYTERYMGLPKDNPTGYRESAVFEHVANMRGKLMIVHGLIDENVHFRHTTRLINKLIAAGKDYDLLLFPDERHSPRRLRDRVYMEQRISDYFVRSLLKTPDHLHSDPLVRPVPGHL